MLCDFASAFPSLVGDLLEREAGLKRRFREETFTDMWVAALVPLQSYGVAVDLSVEVETGADLELWFLSESHDRGAGFLIQAKRAECRREDAKPHACKIKNWRHHRFPELDHSAGEGRARGSQARDLVRAALARSAFPLYAFYGPAHVSHSSGRVESVMLANGFEVRRRILQGLWSTRRRKPKKRRSPAHFKRLGNLADLMFPLSTVFCISPWKMVKRAPPQALARAVMLRLSGSRFEMINIPTPEEIVASVGNALAKADSADRPVPYVTTEVPSEIRRLASGRVRRRDPLDGAGEAIARARIVFVASPDPESGALRRGRG